MNQNLILGGTVVKDQNNTPWWTHLITIFVTAVATVMVTAYAVGGAPTPTTGSPFPAGVSIAVDTITYMPHIILLFGVLADMITYDGVWSIASLVGIISILGNYVMQYFWKGLATLWNTGKEVAKIGTSPVAAQTGVGRPGKGGAVAPGSFFRSYDGCSVQGFDFLKTEFAPQTLVVTATVFSYYIFDLIRNRGWVNSAATIVVFLTVFGAQTAVLYMTAPNHNCGAGDSSQLTQSLRALFEGMLFGGTGYGIVQTYYPSRLPSSTVSPFPRKDKSELTMGPDGKMYDKEGNPYVILPNGQAVPDFSTSAARDAFAKLAGENLGTGTPAKPTGCKA